MKDFEAVEKAHRRYARQKSEAEPIASKDGEIVEIGPRKFIALTNINGLVRAYRIAGVTLVDVGDDEASAVSEALAA